MDQQKIGTFLKQLRQERQLTQENLAEIMCVTNRSVSRWENGVNLPDLPTLIQLADFYGVELRELLDGERKPDAMNTPETKSATEETARKVADYSNDVMEKVTHRFHYMYLISIATVLIYLVMNHFDFSGSPVLQAIQGACLGIGLGMLVVGAIFTSKRGNGALFFKAHQLNCPNRKQGIKNPAPWPQKSGCRILLYCIGESMLEAVKIAFPTYTSSACKLLYIR